MADRATSLAAKGSAAAAEQGAIPDHVVLYDGVCGLCSKTVRWLMKRDVRGALWFAPLQGDTAAALRQRHPEIPQELETVVYVSEGRVFMRSKVFLHAARHLTRPWRWLYGFRWLPAFLLDLLYRFIARIRYRVWGKFDTCQLPSTAERARLLP